MVGCSASGAGDPSPEPAPADSGLTLDAPLPIPRQPDAAPPTPGRPDAADDDAPTSTPRDGRAIEAADAAPKVDIPPPAGDAVVAPAACPKYAAGVASGKLKSTALTEVSGVVESRAAPGVLWVHNDSGAGPRIYAINKDGTLLGNYDLKGAGAEDWEDIAMGTGPVAGRAYIYVGDIGDNDENRKSIQLYRVAEPTVDPTKAPVTVSLAEVDKITLTYPDGAHNAETLMADPVTGDVFIVTKSADGNSRLFRAAAPLSAGEVKLQDTGVKFHFGAAPLPGDPEAVGGDISAAGDLIAIRSYDHAFMWRRAPGQSVAQALTGMPCPVPQKTEPQGEALGFAADGSGYYTVSEGVGETIYWFAAGSP